MEKPGMHLCCEYSHMCDISIYSGHYELYNYKFSDYVPVYGTVVELDIRCYVRM